MSDMPWFQFYPNDWLAGTRGLSAVETGIYITIIASLYDRAEPLPNDAPRLARMCGAGLKQFNSALARLLADGKLIMTEKGIWNSRVEAELKSRNDKRQSARASADARWSEKNKEKQDLDDANAPQTQCETDASQKSEIRSQKERENAPAQDPRHWKEVQGYLADHAKALTDWEVDFLHSVKWSESLTKAQATSLKAISDKLKATEPIGSSVFVVKNGTPEFAAWISYKRGQGLKTGFMESQSEITVPSLAPPSSEARAA